MHSNRLPRRRAHLRRQLTGESYQAAHNATLHASDLIPPAYGEQERLEAMFFDALILYNADELHHLFAGITSHPHDNKLTLTCTSDNTQRRVMEAVLPLSTVGHSLLGVPGLRPTLNQTHITLTSKLMPRASIRIKGATIPTTHPWLLNIPGSSLRHEPTPTPEEEDTFQSTTRYEPAGRIRLLSGLLRRPKLFTIPVNTDYVNAYHSKYNLMIEWTGHTPDTITPLCADSHLDTTHLTTRRLPRFGDPEARAAFEKLIKNAIEPLDNDDLP